MLRPIRRVRLFAFLRPCRFVSFSNSDSENAPSRAWIKSSAAIVTTDSQRNPNDAHSVSRPPSGLPRGGLDQQLEADPKKPALLTCLERLARKMTYSVELVRSAEQLSERDLTIWNRLARNPLQRWEWLGSWWEAYRDLYQLHVLAVKRDEKPVAFAPWCTQQRMGTGRTIQFLGSGKACTDHLSLLVAPEETEPVCHAIASWLVGSDHTDANAPTTQEPWDSIELIGVDSDDAPVNGLVSAMREAGLDVDQTDGMACYVIDLPDEWEDYVRMRSKSGRREIRQSLKNVDSGVISVERIASHEQLDSLWDQFVTLHQRRRRAAGTTGCFDHPPFDVFLRTAADRLLEAGLLEFVIASADGVPVAAQFAIVDEDSWYFYQSGMDPDLADLRPGMSIFCHAIRLSIQSGRKKFDMMRGDEAYKLRWRAEPVSTQEVRACSPRRSAQVRRQFYQAGVSFKNLVKSGLGIGQTQG